MSRLEFLRNALYWFFRETATTTGEDKYQLSIGSEGYLSGSNILSSSSNILSGDLGSGDKWNESPLSDEGFVSGNITSKESLGSCMSHQSSALAADDAKHDSLMRLDSGVDTCTSQISALSINPKLNDLGGEKKHKHNDDDSSWELYFAQDDDGDTELHLAIIHGFVEVVQALIRAAPHSRLLDTPNDDAQSPLHLAVATAQHRIARCLIVAGARPMPRNLTGDSPLHIAARMGNLECCHAITDPILPEERLCLGLSYSPPPYQYCDLDQWNYDGQTCVHVAAIHGKVDVLGHLVRNGADINAREGRSGYTALHIAIERGDERLVHFLLTECHKLNAAVVTYGGRSALQLGLPITTALLEALMNRGVPSHYLSDDEEDDDDDTDDMIMYEESATMFKANMIINASA